MKAYITYKCGHYHLRYAPDKSADKNLGAIGASEKTYRIVHSLPKDNNGICFELEGKGMGEHEEFEGKDRQYFEEIHIWIEAYQLLNP
jgi:hypothetical protein